MDNNMEYTSVNGTFTYTITNNSSYVFEPVDYVIIKSAFDRWDNIMTLDARLGPGYTITVSYTVDVLEAGMLGGASIQTIVYIGSQTYGNVFPLTADLTMNSSYLYGMKNDVRSDGKTSYYYVLLHEIGHILGIGSLWGYAGTPKVNYIDNGITKSYYTGANALREYKAYFSDMGSSSFIGIPIEDNGGGGTAGVHPEEGPEGGVSADNRYINGIFHPGLDTELMSGWLDSSPVSTPLSRVTLGFLEDMGYIVNYNLADVYRMSWPATTDANNLDKAYIQGFLDVSGSTTIRGTTNINGRVFVYDDVSINGFLRAKYPNESIPPSAIQGGVGSNTFAGDVFMDSKMTVTGDVSMNQKLSVGGDVSMNSKMYVAGAATLATTLNVNGITISRGGGNMETNTAFGSSALIVNTTGQYNSAFGSDTLIANTSGGSNTAFGQLALSSNETGNWNSAFGVRSLNANTTGTRNSGYGYDSGKTNTIGEYNSFLGFQADSTLENFSYSTAIGAMAKITASNQIVLGTATETVSVLGKTELRGDISMGSTGSRIDICGNLYAVYPLNSIPQSAIIGGVGSNIFTADVSMNQKLIVGGDVSMNAKLTVVGDVSMGTKLTVNGITIGKGASTGVDNTVVGRDALSATSSSAQNSAFGVSALKNNTASGFGNNSAFGFDALKTNTTGSNNTALGSSTLPLNTTGSVNTAGGSYALYNNTDGSNNTAFGQNSLFANNSGAGNSALGNEAGKNNTTGKSNTFLGYQADSTAGNFSNSTAIGALAKITASNQIVLGTAAETVLVLGKTALRGDISMGLTGSRIDICGNLYAQYPLNSIPQSAIIGGVGSNNFTADVSMNQKLIVGGDVSMNAKLTVVGDVSMGTKLTVNGITIGKGGSNVASNSAFGSQSLNNNGSGATNNSAFGNLAQLNTTTGSNNSAFGAASLQANNVGFGNSAFGNSALQENIGGNNNTAFGQGAGKNNTAGSNNTAIGQNAGNTNTGSNNTFLGYNTSNNPITVSTSTAIGSGAVITASNQIVLGTAGETVLVLGKTALRGDISMGLTGSRIDICGNLYAQYPLNSIPQSAIIGGVGSNNFTADVSMNQKLSVGGDVSMNSKLYVKGQTILDGATSSTDDISVYGVTIGRGAGRRKNLLFGTNPSTNVNLGDENILIGDSVLLNSITSNQIIAIGNNAGTNQMIGERNIFLGYSTGGDGSIRNNSTAIGAYAQITASNQIVLGTAGETVLVLGKTALRGDISMGLTGTRVDICGNLYAQYPNNSIPQAAIIGGVGSNIFTADVSMNQKLIVGGDVSMNTKLSVVGDVSMNQKLSVGGAVTVGSLYSNGAVTSSTLYANGAITTASSVYATGEIRTPSSLYAGGLTAAGASTMGSIYTTGAVSINTALMVGNDASMNAKLSIGGDVSMNSRLYISGPIRQW